MFVLRNIILIILIIAVSLVTGCGRTVTSEQFNESYQVRSGTVIDIYNHNGSVTVVGSEQDKIEISAVKESYQGQSALDQVDIFIDIAEKLTIETVRAEEDLQVTVNFEIKVPKDLFIGAIEGANGDIKVEEVIGNPVLSTSNGTITVNNVNGIVSARSSNGDIMVFGVRSLEGIETSNGNIKADLPALHDDLTITTSNGSVTLALNPNLQATITADTSNGTIDIGSLKIAAERIEQTSLSGQMNDGGYNIDITTSNGSIELVALR